MYDALSEARKSTALARSSGSPQRPSGTVEEKVVLDQSMVTLMKFDTACPSASKFNAVIYVFDAIVSDDRVAVPTLTGYAGLTATHDHVIANNRWPASPWSAGPDGIPIDMQTALAYRTTLSSIIQ